MSVMATEPLGTRIAKRRHQLRLSQEELAERLGVNRTSVANWEAGKHYPQRHIGALEQVLGMNLTGQPDAIEPRDGFEAELLSLTHLPPGEAERLIEMYRARGAEPPRRTG